MKLIKKLFAKVFLFFFPATKEFIEVIFGPDVSETYGVLIALSMISSITMLGMAYLSLNHVLPAVAPGAEVALALFLPVPFWALGWIIYLHTQRLFGS